ncbi:calcium-binding protein [Iodobacter sp.]|uniref:calcium-binding protein n=1 Tax=Iodobacter sp. TaxID=1915058 RepID=UPI0025FFA215|nr:calcium-binding protein [Iodobacter sp.]
MTTASILTLSKLASTAVAAYSVDLQKAELKSGLTKGAANFTLVQADQFDTQYKFIDQLQNVAWNGFSATVFQDKTGNKVFAIRGTESDASGVGTDILKTDLGSIAPNGFANTQAVEMFRYFKRLTTVGGKKVAYSEKEIKQMFVMDNSLLMAASNGLNLLNLVLSAALEIAYVKFKLDISNDKGVEAGQPAGQSVIEPDERVDVTGHSLGGHLAILFARFFPNNTKEVVTLNAPGLFTNGNNTLNDLGFKNVNGDRITRLVADGDPVSEIGNVCPGLEVKIAQENGLNPLAAVANHSSSNGNDSLAVMAVMARLDTRLEYSPTALSDFVRYGSNKFDESLENVVDALRHFLFGANQTDTPISSGGSDAKRSALYDNLYGMMKLDAEGKPTGIFAELQGKVKFGYPQATNPRQTFGEFLSLYYLAPFSLEINDPIIEAKLIAAQGNIGSAWLADKAMSPADRAAGKATFSDEYLVDRAAMLSWVMKRNKDDITKTTLDGPDLFFLDSATHDELRMGSLSTGDADRRRVYFGSDTSDSYSGSDVNDRLYGGAGDDSLNGGKGGDYIEGNDGADILNGGKDDHARDILVGGKGLDTYQFNGQFGADMVKDSDGLGAINIDGKLIGEAKGSGQRDHWAFDLGAGVVADLTVYDDLNSVTGKRLVISRGTDTISVDNFDLFKAQNGEGFLGIKLESAMKLAIVEGVGKSAFKDVAFDPASLAGLQTTIIEGTGSTFTIYLNQAAKAGDSLTLALSGAVDKFQVILGDKKSAANGLLIALAEGQTQVSFALVQEGAVSADASLQLSARFTGKDGGANSNNFGITLKDFKEASDIIRQEKTKHEVIGTWGNDIIYALENNNNNLYGREGNDEIHGGNLGDYVDGGRGNDRIFGGAGNDWISSDIDLLNDGSNDADYVDAGAGEDYVQTSNGNDFVLGGKGNDEVYAMGGQDVVSGGDGDDRIYGDGAHYLNNNGDYSDGLFHSLRRWFVAYTQIVADQDHGADYLDGGAGNDLLVGGGGDDVIYGGTGNDHMYGDGNVDRDTSLSDLEIETYKLPAPDLLHVSSAIHGNDYMDGGEGDDSLQGGGKNDTLYGGSGNDSLIGDFYDAAVGKPEESDLIWGNDYLDGGSGDDQLIGGGKDDTMYGGQGDDMLWGDFSKHAANNLIWGNDYLDGGSGDDQLVGGGKDDTLYGGQGDDKLWGDEEGVVGAFSGNDYLDGGDGKDQLVGGGGDDVLHGGAGDDTLVGDDDLLNVAAEFQGDDYLDGGDGNDDLVGGGGNDILYGGDGDDYLEGGTGADYMVGGAGKDAYVVDNEGDVIVELDDGIASSLSAATDASPSAKVISIDKVTSSISYTLGANLDNLTLTGAATNGTGNALDNRLFGNDLANTLDGGAGNDLLNGGAGADILIGGSGDDSYVVDNVLDIVRENADDGVDVVYSSVSYALVNEIEQLRATGGDAIHLTGNSQANGLFGNTGDNVLQGGKGNDYLSGAEGNDTYVFERGDGQDMIVNTDLLRNTAHPEVLTAIDTLRFGANITAADVTAYRADNNLIFKIKGTADKVNVVGYYDENLVTGDQVFDNKIDRVVFENGVVWDQAMIQSVADLALNNHAPTLAIPTVIAEAHTSKAFSYVIPDNIISDSDVGDSLTYRVEYQYHTELPSWLSFDAATRTFSGTPDKGDKGEVMLHLIGMDNYGKTMTSQLRLNVVGNRAPVLSAALPDQAQVFGEAFVYQVPEKAFRDIDGDELTFRATQADGSPLPSWLSFNEQTHSFSGTPTVSGVTSVRIIASDDSGLTDEDTFDFVIGAADIVGTKGADLLQGGAGNDVIKGLEGDDKLFGAAGADRLEGGDGNDSLLGQDGDDILNGGAGDDLLDGGAGNDILAGGNGANTYLFGIGSGQDEIHNKNDDIRGSTPDTLIFGAGILPADIKVDGVGDDDSLLITIVGHPGDSLKINLVSKYGLENIRFTDGTIWDMTMLTSQIVNTLGYAADYSSGTSGGMRVLSYGNDFYRTGSGNDILIGNAGDDVLRSNAGDDVLEGGIGKDTLEGGDGNDVLDGGAGNDYLDGGDGDDILDGGTGNDSLSGGNGSNAILFGRGSGYDSLYQGTQFLGVNTIKLDAGITSTDLILKRNSGNDDSLTLQIKGSSDSLMIGSDSFTAGFLHDEQYKGLKIQFADGTIWDMATIKAKSSLATAGNDILQSNTSGDSLSGLEGDDQLWGQAGNNKLDGGAGQDELHGGDDNDLLLGGSGNDVLYGDTGNDTLNGGDGNDILRGDEGDDLLDGGLGNDVYIVDFYHGNDVIDSLDQSTGKVDTIQLYYDASNSVTPEEVQLKRTGDALVISYSYQGQHRPGSLTVNNYFSGDAKAGYQVEQIKFGNGTIWDVATVKAILAAKSAELLGCDELVEGDADANQLIGSAANELMRGFAGNDQLFAYAGDDVLEGGEGDDYLDGGAGNDKLEGGVGKDQLRGGEGNDRLTAGVGDDKYVFTGQWGNDVIDNTGGGVDWLFFSEIERAQLSFKQEGKDLLIGVVGDASRSVRVLNHFNGGDAAIAYLQPKSGNALSAADIAKLLGGGGGNANTLNGTSGNDNLSGTAQADLINGVAGNDSLFGLAGNDTLRGDEGDDYLDGGLGNDQLEGGVGKDQLIGGEGDDRLIAGAGDDKYVFSGNWGNDVIDNTGGGSDWLFFSELERNQLSFKQEGKDLLIGVLGDASRSVRVLNHFNGGDAAIAYLQLKTGSALSAADIAKLLADTGTPIPPGFDRVIDGDAANNQLSGGTGKDLLRGFAGNDQLFGGLGNDRLEGGDGDDYLAGGYGNVANTGDDVLIGGAGNDTLSGEDGNDRLEGGTGDDKYTFDGKSQDVIDNTGGGFDGVFFSGTVTKDQLGFSRIGDDLMITVGGNAQQTLRVISHFLGGDWAIDYVQPSGGVPYLTTAAINAAVAAAGMKLVGTSGNDNLVGDIGKDTLTGLAGDDVLNGGAGADTLLGGAGNDTYIVDNAGDVVTELAGEGADTVQSSLNWVLGNNLENLTLTGTAAINGTGNELANVLIGNAAANTLIGAAGNDTLDGGTGADKLLGGLGDDRYVVDVSGDVTTENANEGNDTVLASLAWTLGSNLENLTLTGTAAINGTGNVLNNILTGNTAANVLTGAEGNDTLLGGAGADTLNGGVGNDTYIFGRGDGSDTIIENDATAKNTDIAQFQSGIATNQLWFKKVSNNLEVSIVGSGDKLTMQDWYKGNAFHVEQFKTSDGKVLLDTQVNALVSAMAAFNPPASGQMTLSQQQQDALNPVLAANWH